MQVASTHIERIQSLRPLSDRSRQGLSRVISKNRQLTPQTLPLFVGAHVTQLRLYDCSGTCWPLTQRFLARRTRRWCV